MVRSDRVSEVRYPHKAAGSLTFPVRISDPSGKALEKSSSAGRRMTGPIRTLRRGARSYSQGAVVTKTGSYSWLVNDGATAWMLQFGQCDKK